MRSMKTRTSGGLRPTGNSQGGQYFLFNHCQKTK